MNEVLFPILLILTNYFIGSISSAVLISKYVKKIDIRKIGYKTAGGSNVAHNIGIKWGAVVAVFDILKGIPILIITKLLNIDEVWIAFIASSAVIGHCWPIWFNFSGGRGIGTSIGVMLFLTPITAISSVIVFLMSFFPSALSKYKNMNLLFISSPTLTLYALILYIMLSKYNTLEAFDEVMGMLLLSIILIRRVTARLDEYNKLNPIKLFFSRMIFDNSTSIC